MFNSIVERVFSYKKVISNNSIKHSKRFINVIKNINSYVYIFLEKIKNKIDLKRDYYYLGKYLSNLEHNKYDLSKDKVFMDYMDKIKVKKQILIQNAKKLSALYNKDKKYN
tara:strand:- start:258 stop:590 length:333 start_codon:yes stop_codon:yes gene_type:complete